MVRALSLRQPWAELILQGKKTIETRNWNTSYRGKFYVHAAKVVNELACRNFGIDPQKVIRGSIVGFATLVAVKRYETVKEWNADEKKHFAGSSSYHCPKYGFILRDIHRIKPIPFKGKLNFFPINIDR